MHGHSGLVQVLEIKVGNESHGKVSSSVGNAIPTLSRHES